MERLSFCVYKSCQKEVDYIFPLNVLHNHWTCSSVSCCLQIPAQFVESLLEVHKKYRTMIVDVFYNDQQFVGALDKAFESVVNHRGNTKVVCRSPELLAR